jgi:hypothetical protein
MNSYQFDPMTEEEINTYSLIDDGVYDFQVLKSTRRTSKTGNPMAELQIQVWDKEGKIHPLFDYLVFTKVPLNIKKIKHFCDATGLIEEYKKGEIPENMSGLSGKVEIGTQDEQPKSTGGFYPKKNIVIDYVMTDKGSVKYDPKSVDKDLNDDLPF